jgi:hypothetical protein
VGKRNMNKKLLICRSAIAVVILVFAGLSPVVGFDSVRSSMKDSPLFHVRTSKATQKGSSKVNCEYIGKDVAFLFPKRNSNIKQLQLIIEKIRNMDDDTFGRFIESVVYQYRQQQTDMDVSLGTILAELNEIRTNPDIMKRLQLDSGGDYTVDGEWFPGCYILTIIDLMLLIMILFILEITLRILYSIWAEEC